MNATDWVAFGACATALMAIATFVLAWKTRSIAKETKAVGIATLKEAQAVQTQVEQIERQAEVSTSALKASVQPWLVWVPTFEVHSDQWGPAVDKHGLIRMDGTHTSMEVTEEVDSIVGWFTIQNVGSGIAILDLSSSLIFPRNGERAYDDLHPTAETPVLPPGETVDVCFAIPPSKSGDQKKMTMFQLAGGDGHNQLFTVEVAYGDSLGNAGNTAKFRAHRTEDNADWTIFEVEYQLENGKVITARRSG